MDPYSTHLFLTALALNKTGQLFPELPIVECGCGDYSSPLIAALRNGRDYVIYSSDPEWSKRYELFADVRHVLIAEKKRWVYPDIKDGWGLCLMDSEESVVNRATHIPDLIEKCKVVVMHDAREDVIPKAKYQHMLVRYRPWTWIGSNEVDVGEWMQETFYEM
jgi:hypothetical protein